MAIEQGCYDLRGPCFETLLLGPVTELIIDADRRVREGTPYDPGWSNGFPNWHMYRVADAGDSHLAEDLRLWLVAIAIAYSETGGLRKPSDDVAVHAAQDAYVALTEGRWGASGDDVAVAVGVSPKTYRSFRQRLLARLVASLKEYRLRMEMAIRWASMERSKVAESIRSPPLTDGRAFGEEALRSRDGNFRAYPKRLS